MNEAAPLVSVVMCTHNNALHLSDTIQSVLNQTFEDFEFIIINDGSTDATAEILNLFSKNDKRLRIFHQSNTGLTIALNRGINKAKGRFIARIDSDDMALPSRLHHQVTFLQSHAGIVAVGSDIIITDDNGIDICQICYPQTHKAIDHKNLHGGSGMAHPAVMMDHEALKQVGGYDEQYKYSQDLDLFLRLAENGRLANIPISLIRYRYSTQNISQKHRKEQYEAAQEAIENACRRRGLPYKPEPYKNNPRAEPLYRLAVMAFRAGNFNPAYDYAAKARKTGQRSLRLWCIEIAAVIALHHAMLGNNLKKLFSHHATIKAIELNPE